MLLPGNNKLTLNEESMKAMLQDAINAALLAGEDYIYVHAVRWAYIGNAFEVDVSTDKKQEKGDA